MRKILAKLAKYRVAMARAGIRFLEDDGGVYDVKLVPKAKKLKRPRRRPGWYAGLNRVSWTPGRWRRGARATNREGGPLDAVT